MRTVIGMLIAAALAIGVLVFWFDSPTQTTPVTEIALPSTSSTSSTATTVSGETTTTSTTTAPETTTTSVESHVVETVEEAETILRDLWFGWFEGIYNEDEDRIREVVATEHQLNLAREQVGVMTFEEEPRPEDFAYSETRILRADSNCTVVSTTAQFSGFTVGSSEDVHVLRWDDRWKFFSLWAFEDDLWEADCDVDLS